MDTALVLLSMAGVLVGLAWIARRARRRGTAGAALAGAMAAFDEAWHTTAFSAHVEVQTQAERIARSQSPNDN